MSESSAAGGPPSMVKEQDAWWTVILVDPIAVRIVPALARAGVSPFRVTVVAIAVGLLAAAAFAADWLVAGALLFQLSFLIDCLDGKLARVTRRSSAMGAELDSLGDLVVTTSCISALAIVTATARWQIAVGVVAGAGYLISAYLKEGRLHRYGRTQPVFDQIQAGKVGGWFARHRLYPMPTNPDVISLLLTVSPLVEAAGWRVVPGTMSVAAAFFTLHALRYARRLLLLARSDDEGKVSA